MYRELPLPRPYHLMEVTEAVTASLSVDTSSVHVGSYEFPSFDSETKKRADIRISACHQNSIGNCSSHLLYHKSSFVL